MVEIKKYAITILTPNRLITSKGRQIRTPTKIIATESELETLKITLKAQGLRDYKIEQVNSSISTIQRSTKSKDKNNQISEKEVKVEDLNDMSTIEKLLRET